MKTSFSKALKGYQAFRDKYVHGDASILQMLSRDGQKPEIMVVACCDSRVDPALILQCDPGDLFVVRNVANIVPPFEKDAAHHGTSAALEFGVCFLNVKHLIILGHSQCGGVQAALKKNTDKNDDFITSWVELIKTEQAHHYTEENCDAYAQIALRQSYENCMTFPWIQEKIHSKQLILHLWFFDIQSGEIFTYDQEKNHYVPLESLKKIKT